MHKKKSLAVVVASVVATSGLLFFISDEEAASKPSFPATVEHAKPFYVITSKNVKDRKHLPLPLRAHHPDGHSHE